MTNSFSIITGPPHKKKNSFILDLCGQRITQQQWFSFIYIVPSERKRLYIEDFLLREYSCGALPSLQIYTFTEFIRNLAQKAGISKKILKPFEARSLIISIIKTLKLNDPNLRIMSDLSEQVFNTICLAKINGNESQLKKISNNSNSKSPVSLFCRIRKEFQMKMKSDGLLLEEDLPQAISGLLKKNNSSAAEIWPGSDLIVVDGFDIFYPEMKKLLLNAFLSFPRSYLFLDFFEKGGSQFSHIKKVYSYYKKYADEIKPFVPEEYPGHYEHIDKNLFVYKKIKQHQCPENKVHLTKAADQETEIRYIARKIRSLKETDQSLKLSECIVVLPKPEKHADAVKLIFSEHQLPVDISAGKSCLSTSLTTALNTAMRLITEDYPVPVFLKLFRFPFITFSRTVNEKKITLDPDLIEQISRRFRIKKSVDPWYKALTFLQEEFAIKYAHISAEDEKGDTEILTHIEQIDILLKFISTLTVFSKKQLFADFTTHYLTLIQQLDIFQELLINQNEPEAETLQAEIFSLNKIKRALNDLSNGIFKNYQCPVEEFTDILTELCAGEQFHLPHPGKDAVAVTGLLEPRGIPYKYVFLAGMTEEDFPGNEPDNIFFCNETSGSESLKNISRTLESSQNIFYQLMHSAESKLFISYPETNNSDESLPSSFISELKRIFKIKDTGFPAESDLELDSLYSSKEILEWYGKQYTSEPAQSSPEFALITSAFQEYSIAGTDYGLIQNALAIQAAKVNAREYSHYDGMLNDPSIPQLLLKNFNESYPFSITSLETYGICPFKFYCSYVLRLKPVEEYDEEMTSIERGSLIHSVLARFYTDIVRKDNSVIEPSNIQQMWQKLKNTGLQEIKKLPYSGIVWNNEIDRYLNDNYGILRQFIEKEADYSAEPCKPSHFELNFGTKTRSDDILDEHSIKIPVKLRTAMGVFSICGKIDRIDVDPEGLFIVIDYKTGKSAATINDIKSGLSFQLPVYIQIGKALLQRIYQKTVEPVGGCYYLLGDSSDIRKRNYFAIKELKKENYFNDRSHGILEEEEFKKTLSKSLEYIGIYVNLIRKGVFPVMVHGKEAKCRYCDFSRICGVDHQKAKNITNIPRELIDIYKKSE